MRPEHPAERVTGVHSFATSGALLTSGNLCRFVYPVIKEEPEVSRWAWVSGSHYGEDHRL